MSEGALTIATDGLILYANRRFAKMLDVPLSKVTGSCAAGLGRRERAAGHAAPARKKPRSATRNASSSWCAAARRAATCPHVSVRELPARERPQAPLCRRHRSHRGAPASAAGGDTGSAAGERDAPAGREPAARRIPRHDLARAAHAAERDSRMGHAVEGRTPGAGQDGGSDRDHRAQLARAGAARRRSAGCVARHHRQAAARRASRPGAAARADGARIAAADVRGEGHQAGDGLAAGRCRSGDQRQWDARAPWGRRPATW